MSMAAVGRRIEIRGTVQGVGFRPWVYRLAREMRVYGRVLNDASGVIIDAFAPGETLDQFVPRRRSARSNATRFRSNRSKTSPSPTAARARNAASRSLLTWRRAPIARVR